MQLHRLKPIHKIKDRKRIGHGGKRGTYSGRGIKGQKSRAGAKFAPLIREAIKKYPKLRGYKFKPKSKFLDLKIKILDLETLEKRFKSGEKISPEILLNKKIISKAKGKTPKIKILGGGALTKRLIIEGCKLSKSAKEKIEKTGGTIN